MTVHAGPIPSPHILKEYEALCPGSSDRIIKMAEENNTASIARESEDLKSFYEERKRLQRFAFFLALSSISGAVYLASIDKNLIASALLGTSIAGVVGAFINGQKSKG